jgi:protein TonB
MMTAPSLGSSLVASTLVHLGALLLASAFVTGNRNFQRDFVPISLVDLPRAEKEVAPLKQPKEPVIKKAPPPPAKVDKVKEPKPVVKALRSEPEQPAPPPLKEEPVKPIEAPPAAPARSEGPPPVSSGAKIEGGGSEAGAGGLFGKGDVAVVPGSGTAGGGGGTAASGLGRSSGPPGLPAQTPILRTNREAKPIQTARASYPPMALRMGLEGDVTLKIEVDTEGKVTRTEIVKAAGMGFDEEALKAVKQSRFEPAQKDGHKVAAEFTYIYRFRLAK